MNQTSKGKSPFYPGQPVPVEFFVGRAEQIQRIMDRGVQQVANGKPVALFLQGDYGIGKSSLAGFIRARAEREFDLHGIYAPLGPAESLDDVGSAILEATVRSGAFDPGRSEAIRSWLAKYIGEQSPFGLNVRFDALRRDAPTVTSGLLPFLFETLDRLRPTGARGVLLILDELNGITSNPKFAHFIKGLVDSNALANEPLPLLLMLCGVDERRREMIRHHRPVERVFDVIDIEAMTEPEMREFFERAFESVKMNVTPDAMHALTYYSAGLPKLMHLIGDACYWLDRDGTVDFDEAIDAIFIAADDVGKKYVDQQVYAALRSSDYKSILAKIGKKISSSYGFKKRDITVDLTDNEKKKLNNFLQKMKRLSVLRSGDEPGEYVFTVCMVGLYIKLRSIKKNTALK